MCHFDPIDLLFGGMEKLGPGSNADTRLVLALLPKQDRRIIVDAGCGTGRQTMMLAQESQSLVHAVDSHEHFLADLRRRATEAKLEHLIQTHCMDMADIPGRFSLIDLLWSEGAAYSIGFDHALKVWAPAIAPDGFLVVSELCWLHENAPDEVKEFFRIGYPQMRCIEDNTIASQAAGYRLAHRHTLPREAWTDAYYDVLRPRAEALLSHSDQTVRDFAADTLREIEIFEASEDSYGYVFFVLQRDS
jgi:trans-aconitate methyltransferase